MIKNYYISIFLTTFLAIASCGFSQTPTVTIEAAKLYEQNELEGAKEKIDISILTDAGKRDAYTWHVRGHIYKELYKVVDNRDRNSANRERSIEAFFTAIEQDSDKKFYQMNYNIIKTFYIPSYYNDVVNMMKTRDRSNISDIKSHYEKYRSVQNRLEPDFDLKNRDLNFLKALATSYRKFIEEDRALTRPVESYELEFKKVREYYKSAIRIDSLDYGTNYNLSINLYNQAAYIIETLPKDCDLSCLVIAQEKCVALFKESLPYALTAFKLKPERVEINKALRAVYYSLLLEKKREFFNESLNSIKHGKTLDGTDFEKWSSEFDKNSQEIHKKCVKSLSKDMEGLKYSNFGEEENNIFERLDFNNDDLDNAPQLDRK